MNQTYVKMKDILFFCLLIKDIMNKVSAYFIFKIK